jgi:hypothetical protein
MQWLKAIGLAISFLFLVVLICIIVVLLCSILNPIVLYSALAIIFIALFTVAFKSRLDN